MANLNQGLFKIAVLQDSKCKCNITLRRFRATIVTVGNLYVIHNMIMRL